MPSSAIGSLSLYIVAAAMAAGSDTAPERGMMRFFTQPEPENKPPSFMFNELVPAYPRLLPAFTRQLVMPPVACFRPSAPLAGGAGR